MVSQVESVGEGFVAILARMLGRFGVLDDHVTHHAGSMFGQHGAQEALEQLLAFLAVHFTNVVSRRSSGNLAQALSRRRAR